MSSAQQHRESFDQLVDWLRQSVQVNVYTLRTYRGTPIGDLLEKHLEHTLERLAGLYGVGTYENLSVSEIFASAINIESLLAHEYRHPATQSNLQPQRHAELIQGSERHMQRARALINAARRGNNLAVPLEPNSTVSYRGVYVTPFSPAVHSALLRSERPFVRWQDGVVAGVSEHFMQELSAIKGYVTILFLDADELYDLAGKLPREEFETELGRRLAASRVNVGRVGDTLERHINRLLLHQNNVLRNLQHRLEKEHPLAHRAVAAILMETRHLIEMGLVVHQTWMPSAEVRQVDPFKQTIDLEARAQAHAADWLNRNPDETGWRPRFQHFVNSGTLLEELKTAHESTPNTQVSEY